jgi:hypothetical protein
MTYSPFRDEDTLRSVALPGEFVPNQMTRAMTLTNLTGLAVHLHDDSNFRQVVQQHLDDYPDVVRTIGYVPWKPGYSGQPGSPQLGMERLLQVQRLFIVNGRF